MLIHSDRFLSFSPQLKSMLLCTLLITLLLIVFLDASKTESSNTITPLSINCGSASVPTVVNAGKWIGDARHEESALLKMKGSSTYADPIPHTAARMSPSQFSYIFQVTPGEKIPRLYFNPAPYKGFRTFNELFNADSGPFTLLNKFNGSLNTAAFGVHSLAKESCMSGEEENQAFNTTFSPVFSSHRQFSYFKGDENRAVQMVGQTSLFDIYNGSARIINLSGAPFRVELGTWAAAPIGVAFHLSDVGLHIAEIRGMNLGLHFNEMFVNAGFSIELDNYVVAVKGKKLDGKRDLSVPLHFPIWRANRESATFSDELGTLDAVSEPKENELKKCFRIYFNYQGVHTAQTCGMNLRVLYNEMVVNVNFSQENDDYVVEVKGRKLEGKRNLLISLQSYDESTDGYQIAKVFDIFKLSNLYNSLDTPTAFTRPRDSPFRNIKNLLKILSTRNVTANLVITIFVLINVIVHKLREFSEARVAEEIRPSARAERFCRRFSLSEIQSATENFNEALLVGRGGFGKVYKGLIDNGQEIVAIKRLKSNSRQGRHEFLTEIETLSELRHINLVSLIGYCSDYKEMILVYEYMPNGSLADHLHIHSRKGADSSSLNWKQRLNICVGAARGLDYLHTGNRVIHRDVKASNILLDENLIAKVSDFGLAKLEDRSKLRSHVSTKVKGTQGYLDPYYCSTRKLTRKSDTYAFGVVLLEVLCERRAIGPKFGDEEYCLRRWALNKIIEGKVNEIVAASLLLEGIPPDSLKVFVEVAERCLHDEPKKRPTMAQVVLQLESALELQESRKTAEIHHTALVADNVLPSNQDTKNEKSATAPPTRQNTVQKIDSNWEKDVRKPKQCKSSCFSAWDALRNRFKANKMKELSSIPENGEAATNQLAAANDLSRESKIGVQSSGAVNNGELAIKEEKKVEEKGEDIKESEEAAISLMKLKIKLHCEGCAHKIKRIITKNVDGVDSVITDLEKDIVTLIGIDVDFKEERIAYLAEKLNAKVEIVHPNNGEGAARDEKASGGGGGEKKGK